MFFGLEYRVAVPLILDLNQRLLMSDFKNGAHYKM